MITVDDATEILNRFSLDRRTYVELKDSFGRVLAEDIISGIDVPSFDRSDMDGYAIRDRDLGGRRFKLVGEMHAGGDRDVTIGKGECSWVATGANIPDGANLVVPVENTEKIGDDVIIYEPGKESHISERGCDIKREEVVLSKGCIVNDRNIGILAALGIKNVQVYDAPDVAIISTGDELARINDVNSMTLSAIVAQSGGLPVFMGTVTDDIYRIKQKIKEAAEYDFIITSGGISSGKKDLLPIVVSELGDVLFHRVKMRPGMPMLAGVVDEKPILCMPGNVTSCLVCGHVFLPPIIRRMAHLPFARAGDVRRARLLEAAVSEYGMRRYLPVKLVDGVAYPTFKGSSLITSIGCADGIVAIGEEETLTEGEVDVWVL
ncbi:MAG: molybdopterin molybdenumtransferase MoeA [Candidatus Methanogaster sp.]|uniref:Molybdopterin molybdenumtransferase MoeA n=1 Tax=Candidatus Methanogaster sp. TaxID=3386292 RepID=A0AC61L6I7_9EURY|nr:MAG: molybdopterin molybdenumtransferase MoeA [ANME-2 cluster archaeon]